MTVVIENLQDAVLVKIGHPERKGALNIEILNSLLAIFTDCIDKDMVLTGSENGFCSGLDLTMMEKMTVDEKKELNVLYGQVLQAWSSRKGHKLVFMNGPAVGGGVGFVFAADYTVATSQAWFCLPELSKGLQPVQIYQAVLSHLGPSRAVAWFSGIRIDRSMALMHGVVHELTTNIGLEDWLEQRYPQVILAQQFMHSMDGCSDFGPRALSELFV